MNNYYTDLILKIDLILLAAVAVIAAAIIVYAAIKDASSGLRAKKLLNIKSHIYEMTISAAGSGMGKEALKHITSSDFLDVAINRDREAVFFTETEKEALRKLFASSKDIARIEKRAGSSWNKWRRIEAILSLGYAGVGSAVDVIKTSLYSKDEDISYFSIMALGQIKNAASAAALLGFLRTSKFYRYKIITTLEMFPEEIAGEVIKLLRDKDPSVRMLATRLMMRFKAKSYLKEIDALTRDESDDVRSAACQCLGKYGYPESQESLRRCLKDSNWSARSQAVSALGDILGPEAIPEIVEVLKDDSWAVIESAKAVMTRYIDAAMPYIEKLLYGDDEIARVAAVQAIDNSGYLVRMLKAIGTGAPGAEREHAVHLLKGMINSGVSFSLKAAFVTFEGESRNNILKAIRDIDKPFAEKLERPEGI